MVGHIELLDHEPLWIFPGQLIQRISGIWPARGRDYAPATREILARELEADPSIRAGDQHSRHVVIAESFPQQGNLLLIENLRARVRRRVHQLRHRDAEYSDQRKDCCLPQSRL